MVTNITESPSFEKLAYWLPDTYLHLLKGKER